MSDTLARSTDGHAAEGHAAGHGAGNVHGAAKHVKRHSHPIVHRPPPQSSLMVTIMAVIVGVLLVLGALAGADALNKRSAKSEANQPSRLEPKETPVSTAEAQR